MTINVPVWSFNELEAMIPREIEFPYCVKMESHDYTTYKMVTENEEIMIDVWQYGVIEIAIGKFDSGLFGLTVESRRTFFENRFNENLIFGYQMIKNEIFIEHYKNVMVQMMNTLKEIDPDFKL